MAIRTKEEFLQEYVLNCVKSGSMHSILRPEEIIPRYLEMANITWTKIKHYCQEEEVVENKPHRDSSASVLRLFDVQD
jgi:hypothetical protein